MDLEAEYNNRAKVPGHPAIIAGWRHDAAAFRAAHADAELDLAYGAGERQRLDLFWPPCGRRAPLALFLHGGYWQSLDRAHFSHMAMGLNAHGVAVAVPSYDLCPQVRLAAIVAEIEQAARFLHRRHGRPMLAIGHSAGGHLAAMLLAWDVRVVPAALPISGLFDLAPLIETSLNAALGLDLSEARRLSPLRYASPGGRLHAVVGGAEGAEYTRQSREIARAWGGTWESVPGADHFAVIGPLADPASALVATARAMVPT